MSENADLQSRVEVKDMQCAEMQQQLRQIVSLDNDLKSVQSNVL